MLLIRLIFDPESIIVVPGPGTKTIPKFRLPIMGAFYHQDSNPLMPEMPGQDPENERSQCGKSALEAGFAAIRRYFPVPIWRYSQHLSLFAAILAESG